jgi:mRNA-degrading endonuclease RelE of RelBE toxin-antitoxin system
LEVIMTKKRYAVSIKRSASKAIRLFPKAARAEVDEAIAILADDPRPKAYNCRKLKYGAFWRIEVGYRYRVIYKIDDKAGAVRVIKATTREGAY